MQRQQRMAAIGFGLALAASAPALAQSIPPPARRNRSEFVRSRGGANDYLGAVPASPNSAACAAPTA